MSRRADTVHPSGTKRITVSASTSRSGTLVPDSDEEPEDIKPEAADLDLPYQAPSSKLRRARDSSGISPGSTSPLTADSLDPPSRESKRARFDSTDSAPTHRHTSTEQVIAKHKAAESELFQRLYAQDEENAKLKQTLEEMRRKAVSWQTEKAQLEAKSKEVNRRAEKAEKAKDSLEQEVRALQAEAQKFSKHWANFNAAFGVQDK